MFELLIILFIAWKIYEIFYYKSKKFINMKHKIQKYIVECNQLNRHIEELKNTYIGINQLDFGKSSYQDVSRYNYRRPELKKQRQSNNVYNCSRTVCDNARKQPFKYLCKYFNIKPSEENLEKFEKILNNFEAAEDGKQLAVKQKKDILQSIESDVPWLIKKLSAKKLEKNLGFEYIDLSTIYFPKYVFSYISSGGNSSLQCNIVMDIQNLNKFISYLSEVIKFKNSVAGQRALMTSSLRKKILIRDNCTCQFCGNSKSKEPNLLLEIDHKIPLSKGGITSEDNLQVLCWKCNRSKGSKVLGNSNENIVEQNKVTVNISRLSTGENTTYLAKNDFIEAENDSKEKEQKTKEEEIHMYDKEKGIYPAGQYIVGEDIEIGKYLVKSRENLLGIISLYENYKKFLKQDSVSYISFRGDYHLLLREEGMMLVIEEADLQKL